MVFATSVERKAPIRFRIAARATAFLGEIAPVAIGVAIALAVSWKPLVKSKNNAKAMTRTTISVKSIEYQPEGRTARKSKRAVNKNPADENGVQDFVLSAISILGVRRSTSIQDCNPIRANLA